MLKALTISIVFLLLMPLAFPQCNIVSGKKGMIQDSAKSLNIYYNVAIDGDGSFRSLGADLSCGLSFPDIEAPWSGNNSTTSRISYNFSESIVAVKVFIAYTGVQTQIQPETFTITTNGSVPTLIVDPGDCTQWKINANTISSPHIINSVNAIVTVKSTTPFTTLTLTTGMKSSETGGSSYGLCTTGAVKNNELVVMLDEKEMSLVNIGFYDDTGPVETLNIQPDLQYWVRDPSGKEFKVQVKEVVKDGKNTLIKLIKV